MSAFVVFLLAVAVASSLRAASVPLVSLWALTVAAVLIAVEVGGGRA